MPRTRKQAVVLLSGGLDSTTLLYHLLAENLEVEALSVRYGQRHSRELDAAREAAADADVPLTVCGLSDALTPIFAGARSSQVGQKVSVPEGHYASETMRLTVVPNRNMLLLAVAGARAETIGAELVAYAAHAGDHPIYPDCRPAFFQSCNDTLLHATDGRVSVLAPFGQMTKADIVRRAVELGVPVDRTYSCYKGGRFHCGRCSTCVERREAFFRAGVFDRTQYIDQTDYWKTVSLKPEDYR